MADVQPPVGALDLAARLARVEVAVEGLRHSQNLTMGALAVLSAVVIGFSIYILQRIDRLQDRIDQTQASITREAAATRQELVGVTTAIANAITAAREMRPPIVVVPAPSAPTAPSRSPPAGDK